MGNGDGDVGGDKCTEPGDEWTDRLGRSRPDWSSDCLCLIAGDLDVLLATGGLEGNAASRRGSNMDFAEPGVVGIGILLRLLLLDFMMLPHLLSKWLFKLLNGSLLRRAGSMVSKHCSGILASLMRGLIVEHSNVGSGIVFGEQGGESSDRSRS